MKRLQTCFWVAVRRSDNNHEWCDTSTLAFSPDWCNRRVEEIRRLIPVWHDANPVARIVKAQLIEEDVQ